MMKYRSHKGSLIHEIFVHTADENYITARWCAMHNLHLDFCWLAVHTLEKYMKAVLVWNERSSKGYGHDIRRLFSDVKKTADDLVPDYMVKPQRLSVGHWKECRTETFVHRLLKNGNADNRYLIFGYVVRGEDLHMLDILVYSLRRLIVPLDLPIDPEGRYSETYREVLTRQPEYRPSMNGPLDKMIAATAESTPRTAALNLNMEFAPSDFEHAPIPGGSYSARNPTILHQVVEPLESDDPVKAARGYELATWLLKHFQLPGSPEKKGVRQQVEEAMRAAKTKHSIP